MATAPDEAHWVEVPSSTADDQALIEFALTYNAYAVHDAFHVVADISESVQAQFAKTGAFDASLDDLRAALFFKQRAHRHGGWGRFTDDQMVIALVDRIRELSDARVRRVDGGAGAGNDAPT